MTIIDSDARWLRQSFLLPASVARRGVSQRDYRRRIYTNGLGKFADTTLGGNAAMNPAPQACKYSDLNERRIASGASKGMGRWYSEVIDDNAVLVHMRFGVPHFNSLTRFFGTFYNTDSATLARTGRGSGIAFTVGRIAGMVAQIRLLPLIGAIQFLRFLLSDNPNTKYYYSKPTMPLYWNAVTSIANTMAANMGFVAGMGLSDVAGDKAQENIGSAADWKRLLPDVYNSNGSIDIYKVATRYQRLADLRYSALQKIYDTSSDPATLANRVRDLMLSPEMYKVPSGKFSTFAEYYEEYFNQDPHKVATPTETVPANEATQSQEQIDANQVIEQPIESVNEYGLKNGTQDTGLADFFIAELRDGAQFVTFKVDNPGTVSESFANSVKESAIADKINGMSSTARDLRFNFANGNLTDGIVGKVVGGALETVKDLMAGVASSIGVSGLGSLAGNALVDIPKYWDASTSNLPRINFNMELRSPYGNELSRYQNIYVPLAMILAGALPRSTGFQSYTSPFLVELFCKGRMQVRLGMIDSIEITRGTGNVGWTSDGKPLGVDVSFSVVDMSSVMHMPISNGFKITDPFSGNFLGKHLFSDENTFSDYMAVLTSMGLIDQIYTTRRLKRNFYRAVLNFQSWTSPAHFANWATNASLFGVSPGRLISAFMVPLEKN